MRSVGESFGACATLLLRLGFWLIGVLSSVLRACLRVLGVRAAVWCELAPLDAIPTGRGRCSDGMARCGVPSRPFIAPENLLLRYVDH